MHFSRPGEELAAIGFVAITFYLFVDINLGIYRIFKRKQGLYYWSMILGTYGCALNNIAIVLKYFVPNSDPYWPLTTLFLLVGWSLYGPAQLMVLYSRLHLVNQDRNLQRWMLIMIIVVSFVIIVPSWALDWPAFNPYNQHLSSLYSPREAILDRCTQIAYTIAECVISGVYIFSLAKLLKIKSSVRQRRVMTDLIYVNIIAVCLDILTVVLVFLNQLGISHPVQAFSYILKLKLEFLALNQLMAVAARGLQKESFAERRYHHPSLVDEKHLSTADSKSSKWGLSSHQNAAKADSFKELVVPSPTLSRAQETRTGLDSHPTHDPADHRTQPLKAMIKKRGGKGAGQHSEADGDEEIGVHMWEKRGKLFMEVPWFKSDVDV